MKTETHVESRGEKFMNSTNNTRHRVAAAVCGLCIAMAGPALAAGTSPEKGIVDLTTNYGPSGAIASVAGVSGAADSIQVTFAKPMHPGNFGMGVNFAKAWTKTWNADNTVLTIGGDLDFSAAEAPALIVYLMQTEAERTDISEPNIFKFQDINVTKITPGLGQIDMDFNILSANGKGYSVYVEKPNSGRYKLYDKVNFNSKGVHIKGLENGEVYKIYLEYNQNGLVTTRTAPVSVQVLKPGNNKPRDK